jgi:hypothetical protein
MELNRVSNVTKCTASNGRFGAMAAVARRQFCGKFNVITPQEKIRKNIQKVITRQK